MYQIWANDEVLIYDSTIDDYKIAAGSGVLETNKAGSFTFTIFPDHFYYYQFIKKRTVITVRKSGKILFRGRVLDDKVDYWKRKTLICEGELNFLRDKDPYTASTGVTITTHFQNTLSLQRRAVVNNARWFNTGKITVVDNGEKHDFFAESEDSVLDVLQKHLLEPYGGYFVVTHGDNRTEIMPTLNWLADITDIAAQPIEFGVNLRDFAKTGSAKDLYTAIMPFGKTEEGITNRIGITSVNNGVEYVCDEAAMEIYGYICKQVYFEDVTDPATLKNLALDMLSEAVKEEVTITLTALDMHMLDRSIESYGVNQYVRCISPPHDFAETLLCYKQTFDILRPQNDTVVLGGTCRSLTGSITKLAASGGNADLSAVNSRISGMQSSMSAAKADISTNAGNIQKLNVKTEEYETAQQQMNNLLAKSFGIFHTAEAQTDGSTIHYLHDKPTLTGSTTIWKMTGDAFMVSTDGGKTYSAGMDSSGNALVNILSAIGIEAAWINCDNLMALSANLGGWLIDGTKIYKEIRHPNDSSIRYRVYFKPPVQSTGAVATEILTCEISRNSGSTWTDLLTIDADGSALFHSEDKGTYKIHGSYMELIDADGVQIARVGTQDRISTEVVKKNTAKAMEEVAIVSDELVEEEVEEDFVEEEVGEELIEEEVEEVVYKDKYIPELVLQEDSTDKYQTVINPFSVQMGDRSTANRAYLRRDEDGLYVLRVDRIEIKNKNSEKMSCIKYENGEYVLQIDKIIVDDIDSQRIYTAGVEATEIITSQIQASLIDGEPDIYANYIHAAYHIDSDGGYKEGGVWYEEKWGIA